MATTTAYSGTTSIIQTLTCVLSGEKTGSENAQISKNLTWAAAGGTAPTISGWLIGTGTAAAGDLLLAHATDPLQGMGDATYSEGFTVASTKLKGLYLENLSTTAGQDITIIRGAANGLPIFAAAGDGITLAPGDFIYLFIKAGTAALTTTSNDKLTLSVAAGSPTFRLVAAYGP
jgi:hypothetical protein